jgi:hypothetical protein
MISPEIALHTLHKFSLHPPIYSYLTFQSATEQKIIVRFPLNSSRRISFDSRVTRPLSIVVELKFLTAARYDDDEGNRSTLRFYSITFNPSRWQRDTLAIAQPPWKLPTIQRRQCERL